MMVHKLELARAFEKLDLSDPEHPTFALDDTNSAAPAVSQTSSSAPHTNSSVDATNCTNTTPSRQMPGFGSCGRAGHSSQLFRRLGCFRPKRKYVRHTEIEREIFNKYTGQQRPFHGLLPSVSQEIAEEQSVIYRCLICPYKNHRKYAVHYHLLSNHPLLFPKSPLNISRINASSSSDGSLSAPHATSAHIQSQKQSETDSSNPKTPATRGEESAASHSVIASINCKLYNDK